MRQAAQQVDPSPSWKHEVNRRVAEHKERKGRTASSQDAPQESQPADTFAAKAAARVAARYAKAPSYSEMVAEEARAAVRAAETALAAAIEAQVAAESVLAGLEADMEAASAASGQQAWEPEIFEVADPEPQWTPAVEPFHPVATAETYEIAAAAAQPGKPAEKRQSFDIRWDADLPVREAQPVAARASRGISLIEVPAERMRQQGRDVRDSLDAQSLEVVEAALPIHANFIQFPRELVATRKVRPRRAEGPYAASVAAQGQLSIFEVEQCTISTEPQPAGAAEVSTEAWVGPEWSGIELDPEPRREVASFEAAHSSREWEKPATAAWTLEVAPMNRRLMAAMVDFSLIAGAFLAAGLVASANTKVLPSIREIELGSLVALALICVLYQAFFFSLSKATPGMGYARVELCTFAGGKPALAQRCIRAAAFLLSLLPMGLGVVSALFDEQHLTWHDRLSGTYLRKG